MTDANWTPKLDFTEEETKIFIGKHLLVGITHRTMQDTVDRLEQFHGIIDRINLKEGLVIKLHNSDNERALPPDISRLELARPGQYRLKTTGEVVEDPDYTVTWTMYPKEYNG